MKKILFILHLASWKSWLSQFFASSKQSLLQPLCVSKTLSKTAKIFKSVIAFIG